jgi:L-2-hydroxyglutarate oxidase
MSDGGTLKQSIGIVGAGMLGLAIAFKLQERFPGAQVSVFEKETGPGRHQSGHNSGVLHCGLYYQPGSLKARLAVEGIRSMVAFCREHDIPHDICGKVVVASDDRERRFLDDLAARGEANGLRGLVYLSSGELGRREPAVRATAALLVPEEGIVDYQAVMEKLVSLIRQRGGAVHFDSRVEVRNAGRTDGQVVFEASGKEVRVDQLVCCAGLHSDRVYRAFTGMRPPFRIVPFRGEYRSLRPEARCLVNHLVYPVPDPSYPFLGVHFTRMIHGGREVGPNAVLALKREGYRKSEISLRDAIDAITYPGLVRFVSGNFRFAVGELASSLSDKAFLAKSRKLIPDLALEHLDTGTAGVRAQALGRDGRLVMDFRISRYGRQIHVLNAPSPGATAALAIAKHIVSEYIQSS